MRTRFSPPRLDGVQGIPPVADEGAQLFPFQGNLHPPLSLGLDLHLGADAHVFQQAQKEALDPLFQLCPLQRGVLDGSGGLGGLWGSFLSGVGCRGGFRDGFFGAGRCLGP